MSVTAKAVRGSLFSVGSSVFTLSIGFVRSLILARLLLPEHYGVVTLALFFVTLVGQLGNFGFDSALIHRKGADERALSTHFVLQTGTALLLFSIALFLSPLLRIWYPSMGGLASVFLVLAFMQILKAVGQTPRVLLEKELEFKPIAIIDLVKSLIKTVIPISMAWYGFGLWSLVAEEACEIVVFTIGVWLAHPWRPTLNLDGRMARWYLRFGSFMLLSSFLGFVLMQFDDFWVGSILGSTALGFYSVAYNFARYPKRAISNPILQVFFPTFAKVREDRLQLSRTFYRLSSFLVRLGFLASGAFALVAPEFIRLLIGSKWLPMVTSFRLLVVYAMLLPLFEAGANLLMAVGKPELVASVRWRQILLFLPAVVLLTYWWGINGTALAADLMILTGVGFVLRQARRYVDFSLLKMFAIPSLALLGAISFAALAGQMATLEGDPLALLVKGGLTVILYSVTLWALEREEYLRSFRMAYNLLRAREA